MTPDGRSEETGLHGYCQSHAASRVESSKIGPPGDKTAENIIGQWKKMTPGPDFRNGQVKREAGGESREE